MSEKVISKIEKFFLEIENLQDEISNQSDIEQKFKEGKELIDELEDDDEEQHGFFRYKYHTTYANYLKICGEVDKVDRQEKLAKKYEKFFKKTEKIDIKKEKNIQETLEEELKKIQDILDDDITERIQETFKQFDNDNVPETFEYYRNIVAHESNLYKLVDSLEEKTKENRHQVISSLNFLKSLASKAAYSKRLYFIHYVLDSPNRKEILFKNVLSTEEEINKHFKDLALHFHSDKTNQPNTPIWLQEEHKDLGVGIFNFALEFKDSLLSELKELLKVKYYERKANNFWKITIDYRNAAKGQWNKLKLLKKVDIEAISSDELKSLSIDNGMLAYQEYRIACKFADKAKQLKKQVKLRGYMALCLYLSNKFMEAQLYALSAIYLQFKNLQKITQQELNETKKIFDKVKSGNNTLDSTEKTKLKAEINLNSINCNDTNSLVKTVDQNIVKNSINNHMKELGIDLVFKADRSLVCYQASREEILYTNSRSSKNKVKIHEDLNKIIIKALEAYDEGEYQKFLEILSEEFKTGESLLKLNKHGNSISIVSIPSHDVIDTLLKYGFRSDGISYLLNLLGEILSIGKVRIEGKTTKDLKAMAMNVFDGILSETLEIEAKKLDDCFHELRKDLPTNTFNKLIDVVSFKYYNDIAQEHKDDSLEMPFKSRLEEIRNIARINKAIFYIIDTGKEEIEQAIKTIKEIQDSINCNYQFINVAKWRYEVLEDLIWVISDKELPEESPKLSLITYNNIDDEYLNSLNEQLLQVASNQEKLQIYNKIATFYEQLAEKEEKINQLDSLHNWKVAQKNYEKAREVDPKNLDAAFGFAKCLLKLSKYTQVIELSYTCPDLTSLSEYWRYRSVAYCKKVSYEHAKGNIIEALKLNNKNNLADKQMLFLKKISKENTLEWRINRYKRDINEIVSLKNSDSNKNSVYNILSIDGGYGRGVCGVLPALWLCEIEHRTHRPISHLFDMIAGTSTGGIIAAGLSVPSSTWNEENSNYVCSDSNPKLSALNLLDLYQNQAKDLFSTNNNSWAFFKPKYTSNSLFEEHFGGVRLNNALTELIVPAVNVDDLIQTHLFTRYDARKYVSKNDTFVDTLMAATAAPNSPYKIEDKGTFLDGALYINNPAIAAYGKAIQYNVEKEKISVLSLGTGSYIPDSLNSDLNRGQQYWEQNLHKIVLSQQEGNINSQMFGILGNRYQRWQVWLEEPTEFDDYKSIPNLLELGHQYIEELDASDENPINKLVESLTESFEN